MIVAPGETLMVALGAKYGWASAKPVRKLYCSFVPNAPSAQAAVAE